jgi:hypothetical protein
MARRRLSEISETELEHWKLLQPFHRLLQQAVAQHGLPSSWQDPQRLLTYSHYLSLVLFGLLNPIVRTMRGLCAASRSPRVQHQVCARPVSLGSFSEAQHVVEPLLLEQVFQALSAEVQGQGGDPRLARRPWQVVDSTLWEALPRMQWALWRIQGTRQQAVRLHVNFHLLQDKPVRAVLTEGRRCERAVWRAQWERGAAYVGDRNYGEDYHLLDELTAHDCHYVLRLRNHAVVTIEEELPLSAADRAAAVVRQAWARLGCNARYRGGRVRVVWLQTPETALLLVTNQTPQQLSAELVALLYRYRWTVELFFRWLKCILGNRHWLAESPRGVALQVYLALIAALLLQLYTGQRPNKRMMELLQLYLLGWASEADLEAALQQQRAKNAAH